MLVKPQVFSFTMYEKTKRILPTETCINRNLATFAFVNIDKALIQGTFCILSISNPLYIAIDSVLESQFLSARKAIVSFATYLNT